MPSRILIDANIPIYAGGRPHPLREPSVRVLALAARHRETFLTDAEVLQELLHRYIALRQWAAGRERFREFAAIMEGRIEPMTASDTAAAAELADRYARLSARDLIHAAVMQRLGVTRIVTADSAFDRIEAIERLDPAQVDSWEHTLA